MNPKHEVKVTFIGDTSVGKTSVIARFCANEFRDCTESTIGAAYRCIYYASGSDMPPRKYHIWDTAGQERYGALIPMYLRHSKVVVLVYDITRRETFDKIKTYWMPYAKKYTEMEEKVMFCLIGNKSDLEKMRSVTTEEAQTFAETNNINLCIEVSAKNGQGTTGMMHNIALFADTLNFDDNERSPNIVTLRADSPLTSWDCCAGFRFIPW